MQNIFFVKKVGMIVAFIGSVDFKMTKWTMRRLEKKITKLVEEEGARNFLFTTEGAFDFACWANVLKLKTRYPDICRIYVATKYDYDEFPITPIEILYEQTLFDDAVCNAGEKAPRLRNEVMIEKCDVLVTYCNTRKSKKSSTKSETEIAIEYAQQKKKRVINLYCI